MDPMSQALICKCRGCKRLVQEPVLLPCLHSICKFHVDEADGNGELLHCTKCNKMHPIPGEGFPANETLNEISAAYLQRDKKRQKSFHCIDQLDAIIDKVEHLVEHAEAEISNNVYELRNKIDIEREEKMQEIHLIYNKKLDKLDEFERNCKERVNSAEFKASHKNDFDEMSGQIVHWFDLLLKANLDKKAKTDILEEIQLKLKNSEDMVRTKIRSIHDNKIIDFTRAFRDFDEFSFGRLVIRDPAFEGSAILTEKQSSELIELCNFDQNYKFTLKYQASRDGFATDNHREQCSELGPNLTIIKARDSGYIFGGFTVHPWIGGGEYLRDENAFIFSLTNGDNNPLKMKCNEPRSAVQSNVDKVRFGVLDIKIGNNSNLDQVSSSSISKKYIHPNFAENSEEARSFLAGSHYFTTSEIEVYELD